MSPRINDESQEMEPFTCPYCGYMMDAVSGVDGARDPEEGSLSICMKCGEIAIFCSRPEPGLGLRMPTPDERRVALEEPEVFKTMIAIQTFNVAHRELWD